MRLIATIGLAVFGACPLYLQAADLQVLSGGGAQAVLQTLAPQFQSATGNKVELHFAVVGVIQQQLMKGQRADVVVAPVALLDAVEKAGAFRTRARTIVGRIPIGVVVRAGARAPDLSHPDGVRQALLNARSVVLPDPNVTPTGQHLMAAFAQMGIGDSMQPKITFKNAIDGGVTLVRDGKADLGLFLVTEILPVKGVELAGTLPAALQGYVVYAAAAAADSHASETAVQFVKSLSEPDARSKWKAAGFEPAEGAQPIPDPRVADLVRAGKLRIALFPPEYTKDPVTGELRGGPFLEVGRALAARLGIEGVPVEYPTPPKVVECLRAGTCDVGFVGIDRAEKEGLGHSRPFMQLEFTYLVPAGSSIRSAADVDRAGVRIAAVNSHLSTVALIGIVKRATLVYAETPDPAFELLRTGKADAMASIRSALIEYSPRLPGSKVLEDYYGVNRVTMVVAGSQAARLSYISEFIEEAKASGLVKRAIERDGSGGYQAVSSQ